MSQKPSNGVARKRRVFIVDDHPLVRDGLANFINQQSDLAVCGDAEDSAGAITGIESSRPDVALIDISLKNESGLELVKTLQNQFPQLALIVLSMHDEALYAERALHAGARGYVMKREALDCVLGAIRDVLRGEIYISPAMSKRMIFDHIHGSGEARTAVERLSDRELEVFQLIGEGRDMHEIAKTLYLSKKTVEAHRANIKEKLAVTSAREVVRYASQWVNQQR